MDKVDRDDVVDLGELMSSREVATVLGVSVATLSRWRLEGGGPAYFKLGRTRKALVRYRRGDVVEYLATCRQRATTVAARTSDPAATDRSTVGPAEDTR